MDKASAEALRRLPHGPEFRFLDRVLELKPGRSGRGQYTVRGDEPFLRGHFPGEPLFPGVLLVEAAAQLAGVIAQSDPVHGALPGLKLAALRQVKFTGSARPGEVLELAAIIRGRMANLIQAEVTASVNGQQVLSGELTLAGAGAPAD